MVDPHFGVAIKIGITAVTIVIGTGPADLDLTPIILDKRVTVTVALAEFTLDLFTDPHTVVYHATEAQGHTVTNKTCHTTDTHHVGVSPEITVDPGHAHPTPNSITPFHMWGGLPNKDTVTVAHIKDCPTITVHTGKCYKALIDSGATILLLRYSTYKKIEDCYKTPPQPTTAKLNTADGSPMSALGATALHLSQIQIYTQHYNLQPTTSNRTHFWHGIMKEIVTYKEMVNFWFTHMPVITRQQ